MKKLLKKEVCVLIIFALIWSLVGGCKLILTCLSPYYFTQSTHLQMFMLFLQTCPGCISEIWKKIWGRYLMEPLVIFLKRMLEKCTFQNFQQWFVMGLWWQKAKCSIILYQDVRRNCAVQWKGMLIFPAPNFPGTKKTILRIWNSIISIHSFLSSGVCENTHQVSVQCSPPPHTHTHGHAHTHAGEKPTHGVPAFTSVQWNRGNMQVWLNQARQCGG